MPAECRWNDGVVLGIVPRQRSGSRGQQPFRLVGWEAQHSQPTALTRRTADASNVSVRETVPQMQNQRRGDRDADSGRRRTSSTRWGDADISRGFGVRKS